MGEGALSKAEMAPKFGGLRTRPRRNNAITERSAESAGVKIFARRMKTNREPQLRVKQTPPDRSQTETSGTELSSRRAHE